MFTNTNCPLSLSRHPQVVAYGGRSGVRVDSLSDVTGATWSQLVVARASVHDSGTYTCTPSAGTPADIRVHVLEGERRG